MSLLCHTQKASFSPTFCRFSALGPPPSWHGDSRGLLVVSPGQPGLWDVRYCQGKPRQTFPKLGRLGRDPGWRRACAPPAVPRSQGFREPGWSRSSIPGGPPIPNSPGSRGSGAVCLPGSWKWLPGAGLSAVCCFCALKSPRGALGSGEQRGGKTA